MFDRWNGDGRWLGLRRRLAVDTGGDGRNGLRPLADSCDVEGDQAEVRTAAAPMIVVMTAMSPAVALNPSSAPTRAPVSATPNPILVALAGRSRLTQAK